MASEKQIFDYHEESQGERLSRKAKESPFMVLGIASLIGAVGYAAYSFKRRGTMSTSVFLMQFRVISQGSAVAALTAGIIYTLYDNHLRPKEDNKAKSAVVAVAQNSEH